MRARSAKPRLVNWGCIGLLLAYLAIATAIIVAAIYFAHRNSDQHPIAPQYSRLATGDALTRELFRCQSLGETAAKDRACLAAWAENRRRFFGVPSEGASRP